MSISVAAMPISRDPGNSFRARFSSWQISFPHGVWIKLILKMILFLKHILTAPLKGLLLNVYMNGVQVHLYMCECV